MKPTAIGLRIQEMRHAAGLSQDALSAKAGISRPEISNLERGRSRTLLVSSLEALAKALKVSVSAFFSTR